MENNNNQRQEKSRAAALQLGTEPVGKLLVQYALPAIIAMTASSLYNMIDSIFIGQGVGPLAISGLAITFPFMNLSAAFGAAVGVGASTYISVRLGQRDYDTARHILGNTISLNVIIGVAFSIVSLLFLDPILMFFGASEQTIPYARDYMVVILIGNVFTHLYFGMNAVLRSAGKPREAMYATMFTVIVNTLLDPLFIYVFDMGIRGAALATILSQIMALAWQVSLFAKQSEILHFQRGTYKPNADIIKSIISVGMSPFSMNVCACVIVIFINNGLLAYGGDLAVGAYGIANRVAFLFVMVNMGVNQGMQPIAGYNFGACRYDRLMRVLKLSVIAASVVSVSGFLLSQMMPMQCARLFTTDPTLMSLSATGISTMMMAFPLVGCQMVITNFFQSIGKAKISMFLSLSRQMIFLLPLLLLLPLVWGVKGVWWSMPISDTISAVVTIYMMARFMRTIKKKTAEETK